MNEPESALHDEQHRLRQLESQLEAGAQELRARMADTDEQIRRLCRERPLAMLLGAVAAGYLIGRLFAR